MSAAKRGSLAVVANEAFPKGRPRTAIIRKYLIAIMASAPRRGPVPSQNR